MAVALPQSTNEADLISIESIKKALIEQHQMSAANEQSVLPRASAEHIEVVRRWISSAEFSLGVKASVLPCAEAGMQEDSVAQVKDGQLFLLANCIQNEKQARDVFIYGSIGLMAIPNYLNKLGAESIRQILATISSDQLKAMSAQFSEQVMADDRLVVELYLADLAALGVTPSFFERRDSWQRNLVRKLYSKLKWQSHDLHYLVYRAAKCL